MLYLVYLSVSIYIYCVMGSCFSNLRSFGWDSQYKASVLEAPDVGESRVLSFLRFSVVDS